MKRIKVTDLEEFALNQIFKPYQNLLGFCDCNKVLKSLPLPLSLLPAFIANNPDWWRIVKDRIKRCNFYFPDYIKHDIIDLIKKD
jgi:hypothetical protein